MSRCRPDTHRASRGRVSRQAPGNAGRQEQIWRFREGLWQEGARAGDRRPVLALPEAASRVGEVKGPAGVRAYPPPPPTHHARWSPSAGADTEAGAVCAGPGASPGGLSGQLPTLPPDSWRQFPAPETGGRPGTTTLSPRNTHSSPPLWSFAYSLGPAASPKHASSFLGRVPSEAGAGTLLLIQLSWPPLALLSLRGGSVSAPSDSSLSPSVALSPARCTPRRLVSLVRPRADF